MAEERRPLFHLTPLVGWMNDPNGFCHYKGQYHLFYQYHPFSRQWGPMHWGHAVSNDLLHWTYMPCALAPDTAADSGGCFSGSYQMFAGLMDELQIYSGALSEEEISMLSCMPQTTWLGEHPDFCIPTKRSNPDNL